MEQIHRPAVYPLYETLEQREISFTWHAGRYSLWETKNEKRNPLAWSIFHLLQFLWFPPWRELKIFYTFGCGPLKNRKKKDREWHLFFLKKKVATKHLAFIRSINYSLFQLNNNIILSRLSYAITDNYLFNDVSYSFRY